MDKEEKEQLYRDFLFKFGKEFPGDDRRILRFLLHDNLQIANLTEKDVSAMSLCNALDRKGVISYKNVNILLEIAKLTNNDSAVRVVEEYKKECSDHVRQDVEVLTEYRKTLFHGLEKITEENSAEEPNDLAALIDYYKLKAYKFKNKWDVVFFLEKNVRLEDKYAKWKTFANVLNQGAMNVLLGYQPADTPGKKAPSMDPSPSTTNPELPSDDFRAMLVQLSRWYDKNSKASQLKVLYKERVRSTSDLENAKTTMELFKLLEGSGCLDRENFLILIETVNITGTQGVLGVNELLKRTHKANIDIHNPKISNYRQKLIKFGNAITQPQIQTLGDLKGFTPEQCKDQWTLILNLEEIDEVNEGLALREDNLEAFISYLEDNGLSKPAKELKF